MSGFDLSGDRPQHPEENSELAKLLLARAIARRRKFESREVAQDRDEIERGELASIEEEYQAFFDREYQRGDEGYERDDDPNRSRPETDPADKVGLEKRGWGELL